MPNFINELMLNEVQVLVDASPAFIIVDSSKLKSHETLKLRKDLRGVGAKMKVAKVAIIKRAILPEAAKLISGTCSIGLVAAPDMVAAAKILSDLTKDEKVSIKGGVMDGQSIDKAVVARLASLPSKQQLRGMLVNVLAAPIVGFARVIAEIGKKKGGAAEAPVEAPAAPAV
jgi:large subunit ribosomal protein L10